MVGSYDAWLVVLSVVVAVVSSYVALDLGSRVSPSQGRKAARYWQIGGAISMGSGIWSMHFIGMLAFRLPIPVYYDLWLTLFSLLLALSASGLALYTVGRDALSLPTLISAGALMGTGIAAMHYLGMAAMEMRPPIRYAPALVGVSVLIAVAASLIGLWSAFNLRLETILSAYSKKAGSALIMGAAIAGMHYTGMGAAAFAPDSVCVTSEAGISSVWLGNVVGVFSLMFLAMTLLISAFDAYLVNRAASYAESLRRARTELEERVTQRTRDLARTTESLREQIDERNATNERLKQSESQLQILSRRLVALQESERRQLARGLHDRVGQNLTALGIDIDILKTLLSGKVGEEAWLRLEDAASLLDATADSIENVMSELRPSVLDDYGLLPALHWYAQQFSKRTGIDLVLTGEEPAGRPAPEIEVALFRIAQEALNNVVKHARATRVEIELQCSNTQCTMSISDDGIGFDRAQVSDATLRSGLGVLTMRERAQAVGGRFELRSTPGRGTQVIARIPL